MLSYRNLPGFAAAAALAFAIGAAPPANAAAGCNALTANGLAANPLTADALTPDPLAAQGPALDERNGAAVKPGVVAQLDPGSCY
jgi:hypothetical protein